MLREVVNERYEVVNDRFEVVIVLQCRGVDEFFLIHGQRPRRPSLSRISEPADRLQSPAEITCFKLPDMTLLDRNQLLRREFDFLVADEDGHLALFSTAGYGPIPNAALRVSDIEALPETETLLLANLAEVGSATTDGRGPGTCLEWPALGRRGVFVYDWRPNSGPYERIIIPAVTTGRAALPEGLALLIAACVSGCFRQRRTMSSTDFDM